MYVCSLSYSAGTWTLKRRRNDVIVTFCVAGCNKFIKLTVKPKELGMVMKTG